MRCASDETANTRPPQGFNGTTGGGPTIWHETWEFRVFKFWVVYAAPELFVLADLSARVCVGAEYFARKPQSKCLQKKDFTKVGLERKDLL